MERTPSPSAEQLPSIANAAPAIPRPAEPEALPMPWRADEWPRVKRELDALLAALDER